MNLASRDCFGGFRGASRAMGVTMCRIISAMLLLIVVGCGTADFVVGLEAYHRGDYATAMREFRPLAEQGDAAAQTVLGLMYANGEGIPEDYIQAAYWWRKAAEQGDATAQFNLGVMYANGKGVPEDAVQAVYWYRKAAEQGDATAQNNLGAMYADGEGVPEDAVQAVYWYRKAAEQGEANAQLNLGFMYANGEGVPENYVQAVRWFRKAAEQGNATAQIGLGLMYANGEGIPKDEIQAYAWLNLAAAQGDEEAEQFRTLIRQGMTSAQIAEAQKLSRQLAAWIEEDRGEPAPALVSGDPVRPPGPSRDAVRQVQTYLALLGYEPGPVDGLPGRRTTAAVRRFQQYLGMTPTGRISDELLALLKAVAILNDQEPAEPVSSGSGFLASRDGEVVTNHHVVDGCAKVTVDRAGTSHDATVRAVDADDDLALIKAPPGTGEAATFSESPRASLGEAVTVAGYPLHGLLSRELNVTSGNISALAGPGDDAKRLQITAPVQQGNSGGPLLDGAGNVIGVVVSKLDAVRAAKLTGDIPQNVNFAIKGALVRGFLDIHGVAYRRRASNAKHAPERLAELARGFTVAVHCWE